VQTRHAVPNVTYSVTPNHTTLITANVSAEYVIPPGSFMGAVRLTVSVALVPPYSLRNISLVTQSWRSGTLRFSPSKTVARTQDWSPGDLMVVQSDGTDAAACNETDGFSTCVRSYTFDVAFSNEILYEVRAVITADVSVRCWCVACE
jgi:hypothetical protein